VNFLYMFHTLRFYRWNDRIARFELFVIMNSLWLGFDEVSMSWCTKYQIIEIYSLLDFKIKIMKDWNLGFTCGFNWLNYACCDFFLLITINLEWFMWGQITTLSIATWWIRHLHQRNVRWMKKMSTTCLPCLCYLRRAKPRGSLQVFSS